VRRQQRSDIPTQYVDHSLVERLEKREQIEDEQPEDRHRDLVFWLIFHNLYVSA